MSKYASQWVVLTVDIILVILSFIFAYFVRFDFTFEFNKIKLFYQLPFIFLVGLISFLLVGSYKGIIRHTGTRDVFNVFKGTLLMSSIILFTVLIFRIFAILYNYNIPISITIIHYFSSTFALIISRFIFKVFYESISNKINQYTNVLIYGAGNSGLITYGALTKNNKTNYTVIGFIEDDINKIGKQINQVKIYNSAHITHNFIEKHTIEEVIISIQTISSSRLLEITDTLIKQNVKVKIVPPFNKWIDGDLEVSQIKQVKIEDLLGRNIININNSILKKEFNQKTVLITGAAGSIGSEIARQIVSYNYKKLIFLDQAESPLYDLQQEFKSYKKQHFIIADIRNKTRMTNIFNDYKPDIIFHAAAYKHVPLMEENVYEAVAVNVIGAKIVMDLAIEKEVDKFVVISTDKAVNPTNVMGATKRISELYSMCLKNTGKTKFITTRFGNVLGSNGSVVPIFKKQIDIGGPLTVTHKDITRYFMTIPEACNLVLEAGAMGKGGEIYVFDMGEPIKIFDLALKMIQLSGLNYPEEMDIKITGLRSGEKIYEELLANGENTLPTHNEKIMIAKIRDIDVIDIKKKIIELCILSNHCDNLATVKKIKEIVPEYISNNSEFEKLDT
ncbi:MAG: polysaccharide biosynthesis protein [Polaribacter sp.]